MSNLIAKIENWIDETLESHCEQMVPCKQLSSYSPPQSQQTKPTPVLTSQTRELSALCMKVPCEVRYQNEGVAETLWSAQEEFGYFEEKAKALVDKQRVWGCKCEEKRTK